MASPSNSYAPETLPLGVRLPHRYTSLALFSPNEQRIVTASEHLARLWDGSTAPLPDHHLVWYELMFGKKISQASADGNDGSPVFVSLSDANVYFRWKELGKDKTWMDAMRKYQSYLATLPRAK